MFRNLCAVMFHTKFKKINYLFDVLFEFKIPLREIFITYGLSPFISINIELFLFNFTLLFSRWLLLSWRLFSFLSLSCWLSWFLFLDWLLQMNLLFIISLLFTTPYSQISYLTDILLDPV